MKRLIIFISLICLFLTSGCDDDSSPAGPSDGGNADDSKTECADVTGEWIGGYKRC